MRVLCGDWTLDTQTRELVRSGAAVHVSPKAFDLLAMLVRERPRVLSKAELRDRIWPATFVTETSLANLVAEVRAALADEARRPRYIRTVHCHGYAFCGSATEKTATTARAAGAVRLLLLTGDAEIRLPPGRHVIGREPSAAVWIDSTRVSRRHALITVSTAGAAIEDLGSKNGTFLNGARLSDRRPLGDRDEIDLGPERLVVRLRGATESTETQAG